MFLQTIKLLLLFLLLLLLSGRRDNQRLFEVFEKIDPRNNTYNVSVPVIDVN